MYQIIIKKKAKKFIDKLPINERKRIAYAIEQLPNGEDIKKLKGHDELLRLRVGEYRIIYSVDNGKLIVYVVDAGNRGDIYKRYKQGAIKIFTNVIRKILKDCEDEGKKVTQVELANVLGISRQAFTNKLTRDSFFIDDVVKIANYLGMQVILKGSNEYVIEKED